jgi:hypothetical protein
MDQLRLAYLALAVGLMGFGAIWGWLGIRRPAVLPRGPRIAAALALLLAVGGTVVAVILENRAARPW